MSMLENQINTLLSYDLFRQIANGQILDVYRYNAFLALLISNKIPYQTSYNPGNSVDSPTITLAVSINPQTRIVFEVGVSDGSNVNFYTQGYY